MRKQEAKRLKGAQKFNQVIVWKILGAPRGPGPREPLPPAATPSAAIRAGTEARAEADWAAPENLVKRRRQQRLSVEAPEVVVCSTEPLHTFSQHVLKATSY